ncbi:hypothetical protein MMJ09_26625, partial [Bacillus vallismortis]|nr:hypothetical protein [Bacillus vallismortis]
SFLIQNIHFQFTYVDLIKKYRALAWSAYKLSKRNWMMLKNGCRDFPSAFACFIMLIFDLFEFKLDVFLRSKR